MGRPLGTILVIWGMPGGHLRRYWVPWAPPVVFQCPPGNLLGSSGGLLGGSWVPPGAILVPFWEHLGNQNGPKSRQNVDPKQDHIFITFLDTVLSHF